MYNYFDFLVLFSGYLVRFIMYNEISQLLEYFRPEKIVFPANRGIHLHVFNGNPDFVDVDVGWFSGIRERRDKGEDKKKSLNCYTIAD